MTFLKEKLKLALFSEIIFGQIKKYSLFIGFGMILKGAFSVFAAKNFLADSSFFRLPIQITGLSYFFLGLILIIFGFFIK